MDSGAGDRAGLGRHQQHQVGGRIEVRKSVIDVPTTAKTYVLDRSRLSDRVVLREQTLKSAVALPWGGTLPAGRQRVRGFAWSPVGQIRRVDVQPRPRGDVAAGRAARPEHSAGVGPVGLRVGRQAG
jgi:hypothetical protein